MASLTISCPHCSKALRIDSARLPDKPASFACPQCKGKVVVDKRQLLAEAAAPAAPAAPGPASAAPAPPKPAAPAAPAQARPPAPVPSPRIASVAAGSAEPAPAGRRFSKIPEGAMFPGGIVLGEDEALVREVQEKLAALGCRAECVESPEVARQTIINEQTELCIYVGGQTPAPPYKPLVPLTALPPNFRRRLFLVLVTDNLKTLDGTAAFLHQVNMVLSKEDLPQFADALYSGFDYHQRLYKQFFQAEEHRGAI